MTGEENNMTDLINAILGIDISKAKFDVALMVAGKLKKTHIFDNTPDGFKLLSDWLQKQGILKKFEILNFLQLSQPV